MNLETAREFIKNTTWVFAKSYAKTFPHEYTQRRLVNNDELFEAFIYFMREHSVLKTFNTKQYLYFELDGFEFWEMGRPIKSIQVLNKAPIDDTKRYRFPLPNPEDRDLLLGKLKARDLYLEDLLLKSEKTEQDERQIKFLLDNQRRIHGGGKNIIDHSKLPIRYE